MRLRNDDGLLVVAVAVAGVVAVAKAVAACQRQQVAAFTRYLSPLKKGTPTDCP